MCSVTRNGRLSYDMIVARNAVVRRGCCSTLRRNCNVIDVHDACCPIQFLSVMASLLSDTVVDQHGRRSMWSSCDVVTARHEPRLVCLGVVGRGADVIRYGGRPAWLLVFHCGLSRSSCLTTWLLPEVGVVRYFLCQARALSEIDVVGVSFGSIMAVSGNEG